MFQVYHHVNAELQVVKKKIDVEFLVAHRKGKKIEVVGIFGDVLREVGLGRR
jgi:hypothetical protein